MKLIYGGEGLCRVEGRVVLTPFVLPGERVRVEAVEERPGIVRARLLEVLAPSPGRVQPPCPYFARCGGCDYQHATYEMQLEIKRAILEEGIRRIGKLQPPAEIQVVAAEPWNYRNRAQFHIHGDQIGYFERGSHRLCGVETCPISSPCVNRTLRALREMLADPRWPRMVQSLEVFTDERQVQINVLQAERPVARRFFDWCAERIPGFVPGPLDYGRFRIGGGSFFQVNRYLVERLVETAIGGAEGEHALDLYAGAGLFTVALAERFRKVTAVESNGMAARDLWHNAPAADVVQTQVERYLAGVERPPDFVLLDPPRAGLGRSVVARLAQLEPPRLVIVACDPATLARDLKGLAAAGYRIARMALVDLFPQTYHVETVVELMAARSP